VPPRSADARTEEEFTDALVEMIVRKSIALGRFSFPEGIDQEQGRLYHATYLTHFSFFAWKFPSWLQAVASQCPYQDIRRTIIEDCVDEEVGDVDAGGRCHIDVLYEEAEACGVTREQIAATNPTPIVLACVHAFENFARTLGWETGFAALSGLEVVQSEPAVKLRDKLMAEIMTPEQIAQSRSGRDSNALAERTGVSADKLVFAAIHAYKDQFHGGGELKLLAKYGTTREIQDAMIWGASAGIDVYGAMRTEIDRVAREAVGVGPREASALSLLS
jgi:pyrroloquinoline quinone (PQQ) biosynthesis protein C